MRGLVLPPDVFCGAFVVLPPEVFGADFPLVSTGILDGEGPDGIGPGKGWVFLPSSSVPTFTD